MAVHGNNLLCKTLRKACFSCSSSGSKETGLLCSQRVDPCVCEQSFQLLLWVGGPVKTHGALSHCSAWRHPKARVFTRPDRRCWWMEHGTWWRSPQGPLFKLALKSKSRFSFIWISLGKTIEGNYRFWKTILKMLDRTWDKNKLNLIDNLIF